MNVLHALSRRCTPELWAAHSNDAESSKSKLPMRRHWSRRPSITAIFALTILVFCLDQLILETSARSTLEWIVGDGGLWFYILGFGSAYIYLRWGEAMPVQAKREKAAGKKPAACWEPVPASKTKLPSGSSRQHIASNLPSTGCRPQPSPVSTKLDASSPLLPPSTSSPCSKTGRERGVAHHAESRDKGNTGNTAKLNQAISQAAHRGDPAKTLELLESLQGQGMRPDATSFNLVMRAYCKAGDIAGAEAILPRMESHAVQPNEYSYNTLMNAYAKSDNLQQVEAVMNQMLSCEVVLSGVSYAIVTHCRARRGDEDGASRWLDKMVEAGFTPDCVNYNSMIHACSVRKDADRAEFWFARMRSKGIEPTVMSYTALVDACSKSLDVAKAEKWMKQLLEIGIEPNVVSFSSMIDACARVGDLVRAEHWYTQMEKTGVQPNAYIFSALINACAKACDVQAACDWLQRAEKSGVTLDGVVYGCVINACGKAGDEEHALTVFDQMRKQGIKTHVAIYGALSRPFAYKGDYQQVEKFVEEMAQDGIPLNDYILYMILLSYARAKPRKSDKAEAAFRNALSSGIEINERVVKALSSAVGRARCAQLLEHYESNGLVKPGFQEILTRPPGPHSY